MDFAEIRGELAEFSTVNKEILDRLILAGLADLCKRTWVYTEIITILTTAGTYQYTLSPTTYTAICGLSAAQKATTNTPQPSATTSATGGTLAADNYSYKVTAIVDTHGETLPCAAVVQATAGTTSTVTLTWTATGGASGYRIYGRTDADWKLLKETTAVTWTDDGSETQGTAVPPTESMLMEEINISNPTDQVRSNRAWRAYESDSITSVIYDGITTVELDRVPVTNGTGFQIKAALYPTDEIAIPSILEAHKNDIINYAKWHLYEYPKTAAQPWGDYQKAMTFRKQYFIARANLKGRVVSGFGGQLRAEQQFFC